MTSFSTTPGDDRLDPAGSTVAGERRRLLDLAYRMLGSLAEAEDVVQETYARWYALSRWEREAVASPGGWLTRVAGRVCLDVLRSARVRRERYVGEWVPEPLPAHTEWTGGAGGGGTADPADRITLDESVGMAFLVVLEAMTPAERVAFVLHDVFRYPFPEVARIVGRTPAACRQLASSARRRLDAARTPPPSTAQRARAVRDFKQAWEAGDIPALIGLLDPGAVAVGDGGGHATATLRPIEGAEHVARFFAGRTRPGRLAIRECTVNGQPGLAAHMDGTVLAVYAFDIADDRIRRIWAVLNPQKLKLWKAS
ncbi:RNA polymerase sigma factor (sigma-70 family) [Streptomyces filamentosus]|uniref:RNA polymerase sigma factor SigJ n=1 Tax=Streptomyces filamentosus TaxID=67294 RepID=UPI0036EE42E6